MSKRKLLPVIFLSILLCFVLVPSSHAVESIEKETVVIEAGEVIEDDLFVTANEFVMNGTVKGDLIFFATKADINGTVEGDLMGGGQEITLNGTVEDDVRLGGMVITLGEAAQVADDFMAGAYSLESLIGSLVEGDMFIAVGQSRLAGDMGSDLKMTGGGLELLGTVAGDVQAEVGQASDAPAFSPFTFIPDAPTVPAFTWGLTVDDQAEVGGNLEYAGPTKVDIPTEIVGGHVAFEQVIPDTAVTEEVVTPGEQALNWLADVVRQLITLFIIGALMIWLAPHWTDKVAAYIQEKPLSSLGWGLLTVAALFLIGLFILFAMVLLAMALGALTFDGLASTVIMTGLFIMLGLGLLFSFTIAYFAKIIVGVASGRFIFNLFNSRLAANEYWSMALGVFLIVILTSIPWIGPIISLAVSLLGFGAFWQEGRKGWRQRLDWHTEEPMLKVKPEPA
jgi:hypothetical protein